MRNIVDSIKNLSKGKKLLSLIILSMFVYASRWWIINYNNLNNLKQTNSFGIVIIITGFIILIFLAAIVIYIINNWD